MEHSNNIPTTKSTTDCGILRWTLLKVRETHFEGSTLLMASSLGVLSRQLMKVLEKDGVRMGETIFAKLVCYCKREGISLDELIQDYPCEGKNITRDD